MLSKIPHSDTVEEVDIIAWKVMYWGVQVMTSTRLTRSLVRGTSRRNIENLWPMIASAYVPAAPFELFGLNYSALDVDTYYQSPHGGNMSDAGFHSFRDLRRARDYAGLREGSFVVQPQNMWDLAAFSRIPVFATVLLSGTVVQHVDGWRSSEFSILGLYSHLNSQMRRFISRKIGWPETIKPLSEAINYYPERKCNHGSVGQA